MRGTVKRVLLPRGFAFVTGEDGHDYFLQAGELRGAEWSGASIREGVHLEFTPMGDGRGGNGLRATEARVMEEK
jgi:cold shock CspA family protein